MEPGWGTADKEPTGAYKVIALALGGGRDQDDSPAAPRAGTHSDQKSRVTELIHAGLTRAQVQ